MEPQRELEERLKLIPTFHFIGEEAEAQRNEVICPQSYS